MHSAYTVCSSKTMNGAFCEVSREGSGHDLYSSIVWTHQDCGRFKYRVPTHQLKR